MASAGVPPRIMGIGPVPAVTKLVRAARPEGRRLRRHRAERGLRQPGARLPPPARPSRRRRARQPERRRDRARPSARHVGRADRRRRRAASFNAAAAAMRSPRCASASGRASRWRSSGRSSAALRRPSVSPAIRGTRAFARALERELPGVGRLSAATPAGARLPLRLEIGEIVDEHQRILPLPSTRQRLISSREPLAALALVEPGLREDARIGPLLEEERARACIERARLRLGDRPELAETLDRRLDIDQRLGERQVVQLRRRMQLRDGRVVGRARRSDSARTPRRRRSCRSPRIRRRGARPCWPRRRPARPARSRRGFPCARRRRCPRSGRRSRPITVAPSTTARAISPCAAGPRQSTPSSLGGRATQSVP